MKKKRTKIGKNFFGQTVYKEVCPFCGQEMPRHLPVCFGNTPQGAETLKKAGVGN